MKNLKILISSFVVITLICISTLSFGSMVSDAVEGTKKATSDIGNTISNAASDVKQNVTSGASDIKQGTMNITDRIADTTQSLTNDIKDGINRNTTTENNTHVDNNTTTTTNTTQNRNTTNYTATPVAYNNDTINFFGMTMSRTSLILLITALAAIIIAILVYSYVTQDNDKYRNDDI